MRGIQRAPHLFGLLLLLFFPQAAFPEEEPFIFVDGTVRGSGSGAFNISTSFEPPVAGEIERRLGELHDAEFRVFHREDRGESWSVHCSAPALLPRARLSLEGRLPVAWRQVLDAPAGTSLTIRIEAPRVGHVRCLHGEEPVDPGRFRRSWVDIVQEIDAEGEERRLELLLTYRPRDLLALGLPLLALLGAALAFVVALRARLLGSTRFDPSRMWLRFWRTRRLYTLSVWILWVFLVLLVRADTFVLWVLAGRSFLFGFLVVVATTILPPLAVVLAGQVLLNDVLVRRFERKQTRWDAAGQTLAGQSLFLVPTVCGAAAAWGFTTGRPREGFVVAMVGIVSFLICARIFARSYGMGFYSLTEGKLRDRIFEMAREAGVKVESVLIGSPGKIHQLNAAVVRQGMLYLTDHLVRNFPRREVDAILAHELAHLQHRDILRLKVTALATLLVPVVVVLFLFEVNPLTPDGFLALVGVFFLGNFLKVWITRRIERRADRGMARQCGDPEAFISGLARLMRLNSMPLDWGPIERHWMTHPSTLERARILATEAGIDDERLQALLEGEDDGTRYEIPTVATSREAVFSFDRKRRAVLLLNWVYRSTDVLVPTVVALVVRAAGWTGTAAHLVYLGGAILTLVLAGVMIRLWAAWFHGSLRKALVPRLTAQGIPVDEERGLWVGLAPDTVPRLYDGFFFWDLGFLMPGEELLCFAGEKCRWTLAPEQIDPPRARTVLPHPRKREAVLLTFHDEAAPGEKRGLLLHPMGDRFKGSGPGLLKRLAAWSRGEPGSAASLPELLRGGPPPPDDEVTSFPPGIGGHPRQVVGNLLQAVVAAFFVSFVVGLPPARGGLYVVGVAALTGLWDAIPFWRARKESPEPPERRDGLE